MLRVIDYTVTISFGSILNCGCLTCTVVVLTFFCSVWVYSCVLGLVIRVLVFTVFCIVCTVILYCLVYVYVFLLVLSVLPPSDNSIAVNNNNNNNNNNNIREIIFRP
jgi:hypothetical protein